VETITVQSKSTRNYTSYEDLMADVGVDEEEMKNEEMMARLEEVDFVSRACRAKPSRGTWFGRFRGCFITSKPNIVDWCTTMRPRWTSRL
jgi:hypothetical protein